MNHSGSRSNGSGDWVELVRAARQGCSDARGRVLDACRDYLLLVANEELGDDLRAKVGASDLVQDSMLEANRDFGSFLGGTQAELLAWMREILLNNLINVTRGFRGTAKRQIDRERPLDGPVRGAHERSLHSRDLTPASSAMRREQLEALDRAVARLPSDYRRVVELRNRDGLPFADVGRLMDRTEDAVQKLWVRAVLALKGELGHVELK